jgi:hypothetical protein
LRRFLFCLPAGTWQEENLQMVAISSFYALSAYALAYSWDIMWLDGLFALPPPDAGCWSD